MALIQQESSFRADVISENGDYGLMQVNEKNHALVTETLGVTDFLEPYNNVRSGMFILRNLFEKYETPEKVLMAYNLGESGASRLWENGIFEINYSKSVFQYQQKFNEEIEILAEYLPKPLSKEELEKIIDEVIQSTGATTIKEMGPVMKAVKEKVGPAGDGKIINEIVKQKLN